MITGEDPILQIKILRIVCYSCSDRTDLDVFAQVLQCDEWAILCREGQSSNHATDVPSIVPCERIFI